MTDSAATPTKMSSSTRTIIIAVVVVIALAGGAFVVYKLTNKKDVGTPAVIIAQTARKAAQTGDLAKLTKVTTADGKSEMALLKGKLSGLVWTNCVPNPYVNGGKLCTFTRPGGQLSIGLVKPNGKWLVASARLGAAGLPPTTPPST
ncbi:MAG: hypothetical protein ABJC79_07700 [Acidimicrobiia bacterium]